MTDRQQPPVDDALQPLLDYIAVTRRGIESGLFFQLPLDEIRRALLKHLADMERLIAAYAELRVAHVATARQADEALAALRQEIGAKMVQH